MKSISEAAESALKYTFGEKTNILSHDIISNGNLNICMKINCNQYENPLFLKLEKDIEIPCTQKYQIKREVSGINLCKEKDICVPMIIKADENGTVCGNPWILEEFIAGKLIGGYLIDKENKRLLGREFEIVFKKLLSIESNYYGDTFDNGLIGKHNNWCGAISKITSLLFSDCSKLNIFDNTSHVIVEQALKKALSYMKYDTKPVLYHSDLFSQNVFAKEYDNEIYLGCIIDFGMSLFAPIHYVQYQTRRRADFQMENMDVCEVYGVDRNELNAYDILRIEPVLMMNLYKYNDGTTDFISQTNSYIDKCRDYIKEGY
jgi:hypothetical protein